MTRPTYHTRVELGVFDALEDVDRVADDLVDLAEGVLLLPASEVQFLSRRLQQLTRGLWRYAEDLNGSGEAAR